MQKTESRTLIYVPHDVRKHVFANLSTTMVDIKEGASVAFCVLACALSLQSFGVLNRKVQLRLLVISIYAAVVHKVKSDKPISKRGKSFLFIAVCDIFFIKSQLPIRKIRQKRVENRTLSWCILYIYVVYRHISTHMGLSPNFSGSTIHSIKCATLLSLFRP